MIISEKKYTKEEYVELFNALIQSPDLDTEFRHLRRSVLDSNPGFYLYLYTLADYAIKELETKGETKGVNEIKQFRQKLDEYTNILPADLPMFVFQNKLLVNQFLADHKSVAFKDDDWNQFKYHILEQAQSLTSDFQINFLGWCIQMLKMNFERHSKHCESTSCKIDQGYHRRIQFIETLLEQLTPRETELQTQPESENTKPRTLNKIQWLGSQKELAELFVELKRKGWIAKFENATIQDCFTESKNVPHYLKPGTDTKTGEDTYENLYTGYSPQFYGIKENPKRPK